MWNGICSLWNSGAYGAWGWIGMILSMVLWVAVIAGVIYLLIRLAQSASSTYALNTAGQAPLTAVEVAKLRYARGEIDRETYLKLVEDLK
jgi:putative membrane protein